MNLSSREFASHELGAKLRSQSNCDRSDSNFRPMKDLRNGVGVSFCWPLSPETETAAFGIGAVDCVSHAFMLHCSTSGYSVLTAVEHSQNPMARRPRLPLHGLCNLYGPNEKKHVHCLTLTPGHAAPWKTWESTALQPCGRFGFFGSLGLSNSVFCFTFCRRKNIQQTQKPFKNIVSAIFNMKI